MGIGKIPGEEARFMAPVAGETAAARQPPPSGTAPERTSPPAHKRGEPQQPSPTREDVRRMSRVLNKIVESLNWNIKVRIDETSDRIVTQIVDPETDEIIKQIPPQELLDIMSRVKELVGLLLDREA